MDALRPRERVLGPALRTQPDRRLVALARDGSGPAQEEIVRRYRAALVRYAGSIVGAAAAEDVVQEALAKAVAALDRGDEELRLRPWLYAIVRNTALNHLRDAAPAAEQLDENYDGVEQPPQALERREGVRSLLGGLRRLPREQREALVKRELEGRSHEEIAADLGVSSGAVRQLIFRAREALRVGFGSLLPTPLLRWLAEGGAGGGDAAVGAAAGVGGGALAAKAAVAVFAAGAAVTAGVAIDHGARQGSDAPPAAEAALRPAVAAPDGSGGAVGPATEPVASFAGAKGGASDRGDQTSRRSEHSGTDHEAGDDRGGGGGGDDSGGGPGPSAHSGPGRNAEESDGFQVGGDDGGRGEHSGSGGPGRSGDRSGSSHSGHGGGGSEDRSGDHSGSGSSTSGSDGSGGSSGGSGKGSSNSGSSGGDGSDGLSGDDGHGGGDDGAVETTTTTLPAPAPAPAPEPAAAPAPAPAPVEETSSGSGSGGSNSGDGLRDLSSDTVSQGSDDPD